MARIGYVRVSKRDQHPEVQADRLRAAGCERVYVDHGVSGKLARRPEWDKCLAALREGDALISIKLDRIGRSARDLIEVAENLKARGVDLVMVDQPVDTSSPAGKLFFVLLAAFAEFERDLIIERTRDGLEAAKAKGNLGGRPNALTREQQRLARRLHEEGNNVVTVARMLGTSRGTIYRTLESADVAAVVESLAVVVSDTGLRTASGKLASEPVGAVR